MQNPSQPPAVATLEFLMKIESLFVLLNMVWKPTWSISGLYRSSLLSHCSCRILSWSQKPRLGATQSRREMRSVRESSNVSPSSFICKEKTHIWRGLRLAQTYPKLLPPSNHGKSVVTAYCWLVSHVLDAACDNLTIVTNTRRIRSHTPKSTPQSPMMKPSVFSRMEGHQVRDGDGCTPTHACLRSKPALQLSKAQVLSRAGLICKYISASLRQTTPLKL